MKGKFEGNLAFEFIKMGNLPKRLRTTVLGEWKVNGGPRNSKAMWLRDVLGNKKSRIFIFSLNFF